MNLSEPIKLSPVYSYKVGESRVHLFSETKTWLLNGSIFAELVPLLAHGSNTVETILERLINDFAPERIFHALDRLSADALVTSDTSGDSPEELHALLNAERLDGSGSSTTAVSITAFGIPPATLGILKKSLKSSGVQIVTGDGASINILLTNDYLNAELDTEIKRLDQAGAHWIVMKPVGTSVWIGPESGGTACWKCLTGRLLDNRLGQHFFPEDLRESSIPPLASQKALSTAAVNMLASHIAITTHATDNGKLKDHILVMDPVTLEIDRHYVLQDPSCGCAQPLDQGDSFHDERSAHYSHHERNYRAVSSTETYDRIAHTVSPVTGLIPELNRSDEYDSTYIYYARHGFSIDSGLARNRIMGKPSWACGKGSSDIDARVSCIAEAIERYSSGYFGNEPVIRGRIADLDDALHPNDILLYSEAQYDGRDKTNRGRHDFHWVPERFDPDAEIEWVRFHSLADGDGMLVPARLTYLNYDRDPGNDFGRADSNGCATGNTEVEAALFALFELIERDSVAIWWFNEHPARRIDHASFDDYSLSCIARSLQADGRRIHALDITTDNSIHTFAAISWHGTRGDNIFIGYGTHLDPLTALRRAFNEVIQVAAYQRENPVSGDPVLNEWMARNISELRFLAGSEQAPLGREDFSSLSTGSLQQDLAVCTDKLQDCGLDAYVHVLTRGTSLLPTVRVMVPGMRHFWPRYAAGRLYDVPVKLGRTDSVRTEAQLNRLHYPL